MSPTAPRLLPHLTRRANGQDFNRKGRLIADNGAQGGVGLLGPAAAVKLN